MGGCKDWLENLKNDTTKKHETGTDKIKKKSTKEIHENLELLKKWLLEHNLKYLVQKDPNIKKIIELPELHDFKMKDIDTDFDFITIHWSTDFNWNLRQLLIKNWFNKNNVSILRDSRWALEKWIHITFYWWCLRVNIKQEKLSS